MNLFIHIGVGLCLGVGLGDIAAGKVTSVTLKQILIKQMLLALALAHYFMIF